MAEYIERAETAEFFEKSKQTMWHKDDVAATISSNKNIPTADVVEVVHGKWVHIKDCGGGKCSGHCSVCWAPQEADNPSVIKEVFRYCRWCGAKMDGDDFCSYGERRSEDENQSNTNQK